MKTLHRAEGTEHGLATVLRTAAWTTIVVLTAVTALAMAVVGDLAVALVLGAVAAAWAGPSLAMLVTSSRTT